MRSIVKLREGHSAGSAMVQTLDAWLRERLAHFKCPRTIIFVDDVPRSAAGKVQRKQVRDEYANT